jgi:putative tricarboxylic transport membrane protein
MDLFANLLVGLETSLQPMNIMYCFIGALLGTFIGVLPGVGPSATIAMLLPITFSLSPDSALIMLAGIYYGAQYGGSTTAILINLPGESAAAVTAIDGYQMARQGRAGPALAVAALGSFFAGTVATLVIALFAPPLTEVALKFGPAEYFSLIVLGLLSSIALAHGSVLKALAMVGLGLLLGSIGTDIYTGTMRFTLGFAELADGVNFVSIAVGVFGVSEILRNLENERTRDMVVQKVTSLMPSREDIRASAGPILRGTVIGSALGILPGGGATLSSFASYTVERKLSRTPEKFGKGAIQGVAGPEAANNAGAQTSFIPMLSLGIPSNAVMALMVGAMILQGIVPGPNVATTRPELFWGLITSMWVGNLMLVLLNLPLVGLWVRLLRVPYYALFPAIILFSAIGIYSVNSNAFDLYSITVFGILGYLLIKLGCEPAPLLLGFILGPMFEEQLRRAMILSHGDPSVFVTRPISGSLLLLAAVVLGLMLMPSISRKRQQVFVEED